MTYETTKPSTRAALPATPRDLLTILLRHRVCIVATFCGLALLLFGYVALTKPAYEAHMSILVKRERVDPVVTTEETPLQQVNQGLAEQDLNSEVELLKSQDLIEKAI